MYGCGVLLADVLATVICLAAVACVAMTGDAELEQGGPTPAVWRTEGGLDQIGWTHHCTGS